MKVLGLGLVLVWALLTSIQIETWASNRTLWTHAARTSPRLARPAINLAASFAEDPQAAALWLHIAITRLPTSPRQAESAVAIRGQLRLLTAFGSPACLHPDVRPYC